MGTVINIKTADFGNSGFDFFAPKCVNGSPNLRNSSASFGDITDNAKRIINAVPVYLELNQTITFYGLKGKDNASNDKTLVIDGCAYSQKASPSSATIIGSISNSYDNFFTLNRYLNDEFEWVNTLATGWFVFVFSDSYDPNTATSISPSGFDIAIKID